MPPSAAPLRPQTVSRGHSVHPRPAHRQWISPFHFFSALWQPAAGRARTWRVCGSGSYPGYWPPRPDWTRPAAARPDAGDQMPLHPKVQAIRDRLVEVVGPLTDPTAHGGRAEDAFDLVLPSLPGYGFSGEPTEVGWNSGRVARAPGR